MLDIDIDSVISCIGISMIFFGFIGYLVGRGKGYGLIGVVLGVLFGIIGLIITVCLRGDRIYCPWCNSLVSVNASVCPRCTRDIYPQDLDK